MEPGPVFERCRNGSVIRWARGSLVVGQYYPLQPRMLDMIGRVRKASALRKLESMGYTQKDLDESNPYNAWMNS